MGSEELLDIKGSSVGKNFPANLDIEFEIYLLVVLVPINGRQSLSKVLC